MAHHVSLHCAVSIAGTGACRVPEPSVEIVGQDLRSAPADLPPVFGPHTLAPVAETTRLGDQEREQGVAVRLAIGINSPGVQDLVERGAELVHGCQQALVAGYTGVVS